MSTTLNNMSSNDISLRKEKINIDSSHKKDENKNNHLPIPNRKKFLKEQKNDFENNDQISDKLLLVNNYHYNDIKILNILILNLIFCRIIKNKLLHDKEKYGYIVNNFPKTIEQAQQLFNLKYLETKENNSKQFLKDKIYPSII